ncbi:hypothetical protein BKK79_00840 [Cupriavidus sp. USMAA2-4]|uniref:ParB/RepB/Spo0J family partition protein n=1 Tax=Cupriavidus sp. USMAA2-4 TaxID=876364 RepID=UPI0008A69085|nr:ParB N-terminal domain-containing protein [Cupriavidus sp. USMAA2-4]AOY90534.1 hypothetical protein BKK79_00840 [Cupriavidus sp. USMAA2-4]
MAKNSIDAYGASGKTNALSFDPEVVVLVTDKTSPLYDERVHLPVDEGLAKNIDFLGVLEPILILKNPETGDVEVVVGRQRVKAARLANQWRRARGVAPLQIPALVHKGKRESALDVIVAENEARTADTPLGRAEKMRKLAAIGRSEDQIAIIFKCTVATVRDTMRLLECTAAVQEAVDSGKVNLGHAKKLAALPPAEQRSKVQELVAAGETTTGHERARAQRAVMGEAVARMKTRKQIEAELSKAKGERAAALRWVLGTDATAGARQ